MLKLFSVIHNNEIKQMYLSQKQLYKRIQCGCILKPTLSITDTYVHNQFQCNVSYLCYTHSIIIHAVIQICADKFKVVSTPRSCAPRGLLRAVGEQIP